MHKKKSGKNKQRKHKRGKKSRSFIEIEEKAPAAKSLLQLSRVDSGDTSEAEDAELSLKRMARKMAGDESSGGDKSELSVDSKATESSDSGASEIEKPPSRLGGGDRARDTALRTALREAEAEESLRKAEAAARGDGGPGSGLPEPYKPDRYTDKVSKRLIEEAEEEKTLRKLERGATGGELSTSPGASAAAAPIDSKKDGAIKRLLEESDAEESLKKAEKNADISPDASEDRAADGSFVQMHSRAPASRTLVQLSAQVSA